MERRLYMKDLVSIEAFITDDIVACKHRLFRRVNVDPNGKAFASERPCFHLNLYHSHVTTVDKSHLNKVVKGISNC